MLFPHAKIYIDAHLARVRALAAQAAESTEASQVFVDAILEDGGHISPPCAIEAKALRALVGAPAHVAVVLVQGDTPPTLTGEPGYHTTVSGRTRVSNPGAYGHPTAYHRSTERVEVGVLWLTSWRCRGGAL